MAQLLIHAHRNRFGQHIEHILQLGQILLVDVHSNAVLSSDLFLFLRVAATSRVANGGTIGLGCQFCRFFRLLLFFFLGFLAVVEPLNINHSELSHLLRDFFNAVSLSFNDILVDFEDFQELDL